MNKSQTKEYRRERSWKWRQKEGKPTIRNLRRVCRQCKVEFSPRHTKALTCSIPCGKQWNKENRVYGDSEKRFKERLLFKHKLSVSSYEKILEEQHWLCQMCKEPFGETKDLSVCIDHDHKCCGKDKSCDRCRRGLIHSRCNLVIGHAKDSRKLLQQADKYLEKYAL